MSEVPETIDKARYNFKSEIIIRHVTPMIHFQHGKTIYLLRATEVKPLLDKYLDKYLDKNLKSKINNWHIKNQNIALDYKMHIDFVGNREKSNAFIKPIYPTELSNDSIIKKKLKLKSNSPDLKITLLSFCKQIHPKTNQDILSFINSHIEDFFSQSNFGKTKSKNFGKFKVISINGKSLIKNDYKEDNSNEQ